MANKEKQVYNILLLGETGSGKSTLINSFANYSAYKTFNEALNDKNEICLIPTKFSCIDDDLNETTVNAGDEDPNECLEVGESGTVACKSYVFDLKDNVQLRFIDSSGFNSTQGEEHDIASIIDLSDYAIQFKELHTIAIVLGGYANDMSTHFEYCLTKVVKNITDGQEISNVIFIFTHGAKNDQSQVVKKLMDNLSLSKSAKENVFCFENEAFRQLMTAKKFPHTPLTQNSKRKQSKNWEIATAEFKRLLEVIVNLDSHDTAPILSSNESMTFIKSLSIAVGSILMNIDDTLATLTSNQKSPTNAVIKRMSVNNIDKQLPVNEIEKVQTVCTSFKKCKNEYLSKFSTSITAISCYDKICCKGCKPPFGNLTFCDSISHLKCKSCKCSHKQHELISYQLDFEEIHPADIGIDADNVESYIDQLSNESQAIQTSLAQLLSFAKQETASKEKKHKLFQQLANKILAVASPYKLVLQRLENVTIPPIVDDKTSTITTEDVCSIRDQLYRLPNYGDIVKNVCEASNKFYQRSKKSRDVSVRWPNKVFFA